MDDPEFDTSDVEFSFTPDPDADIAGGKVSVLLAKGQYLAAQRVIVDFVKMRKRQQAEQVDWMKASLAEIPGIDLSVVNAIENQSGVKTVAELLSSFPSPQDFIAAGFVHIGEKKFTALKAAIANVGVIWPESDTESTPYETEHERD